MKAKRKGILEIYNHQPVYDTFMYYDMKTGKCIKNLSVDYVKNVEDPNNKERYKDLLLFGSYKAARRFYKKHKVELDKYDIIYTVRYKKGYYQYHFNSKKNYLNFNFKYWEENGDEAYLKKYHPEDLYLNYPYKYNEDDTLKD